MAKFEGKTKVGFISLKKANQNKEAKKTSKLVKNIQDGSVSTVTEIKKRSARNGAMNKGLVYIGHIPHGFYEAEMREYFKQFGNVTNIKVCRSSATGRSKGYGFVEFSNQEVAKIAAETMNNYLMFKKRVVAIYVPFNKRPKFLFVGKPLKRKLSVKFKQERQLRSKNKIIDDDAVTKLNSITMRKLSSKLEKLKKRGIDLKVEPVDKLQV